MSIDLVFIKRRHGEIDMREEINLRELIEMVLKRKWIICIITGIAVLISGIYSFFMMKPIYSATSTLLTNPIEKNQSDTSDGINAMMNSLVEYPVMTIDTYKEQVINNTVLTNTINELNYVNSSGTPMQWSELANKISVSIIDKTNLLKITVSDSEPEKAAKIANSVSENFIKYISNNTRKFGEQATSIIEEQLATEEKKMEEQSKKVQEYLNNSQNVEQIRMEIQGLYTKINSYKMDLISVEKQITSDSDTLKVLLEGKNTFSGIDLDNNFKINVPLDNDNSYQNMEISINSSNELQTALITIKATEIETRLIQNLAEKNSLQTKINELENTLKDIQTILTEEEYKYNAIQRNYNLAEQTYNAYLERHKEALLAATSNIGESTIIVSSPATIPLEPSGRGKTFYLAIGAFVGLLLGILFTLIFAYWDETDPQKFKKKNEDC